jgi:hypothetical protein
VLEDPRLPWDAGLNGKKLVAVSIRRGLVRRLIGSQKVHLMKYLSCEVRPMFDPGTGP